MIDSRYSGAIGGAAQGAAAGSAFGPWGTAIGGIAGGLSGLFGGGGEDEAKELAKMQERMIWSAYKENARQKQLEMKQVVGLSTATTYASNLQNLGSPARHTKFIESEFRKSMAWDRQKAKIEAEMAALGGQMASDQIQMGGISSAIGGLTSAVGAFAPTFKPPGTLSPIAVKSKPWGTV